jgi:DNA-binding Xre family transcriptional regulator
MIQNERQYAITKAQAERFRETLARLQDPTPKRDPRAAKAMQAGIVSQLEELEEQLADYEKLRGGAVRTIVADSIVGLADVLIKARIVRNWTQKQLGERLDLPEQQIQRYESTRYRGVAMERLQEVADALGIKVQEVVTFEET